MTNKKSADQYSAQETAQRRDALLKHMMAKPPKPHSEMKVGKPGGKRPAKRAKR